MKEESRVSHKECISQPSSISTEIDESEVGFITHENALVHRHRCKKGKVNKVKCQALLSMKEEGNMKCLVSITYHLVMT